MSLSSVAMGKLVGMSHVAILKAAKRGRIPREPDGGFDEVKVRQALAENTDLRQKHDKPPAAPAPDIATASEAEGVPDDPTGGSFHEAQRAREWVRVADRKSVV